MVSTKAVSTSSSGDAAYRAWDAQLAACQALRTPLVAQIDNLLHNATFNGAAIDPITAQSLTEQANELVTDMRQLNADASPPNFDLCGGTPPNTTGPQGPPGPPGSPGQRGAGQARVRRVRRVRAARAVRPARRRRSPAPPRSTAVSSSASPASRSASRTVPVPSSRSAGATGSSAGDRARCAAGSGSTTASGCTAPTC